MSRRSFPALADQKATPLDARPADLAEVTEIVTASGTSFAKGMRVLPPDRRYAMYAIYAFCRLVDDVADEPAPLDDKRERLDAWRRRIASLYAPADPTAPEAGLDRVLRAAIAAFDLRRADFEAVIDGMQMDAETVIVAPPLAELDLYCDRVAAAVGRLSVRAFGDASPDADRVAFHLGRALQITNILRDLSEDAERGRLYLPAEWLDEAGVPHDPAAALRAPGLAAVCARMAAASHDHFAQARAAMRLCRRRAMKPARLMAASYGAILSALERRGWDRPGLRVRVPKWRKLGIGLRALLP